MHFPQQCWRAQKSSSKRMTSERFWHCLLPAPGKVGSPRQIGGSPGALSSLTAQESPPAAHRAAGLSSPTAFIYCLPALSCSNQCITKFHSEAKKQSTEKKKKVSLVRGPDSFYFLAFSLPWFLSVTLQTTASTYTQPCWPNIIRYGD